MNKKIKINYIFNTSYQIFAIIVPLITTPYISRVLNAEGIGIYSYTYAIIKYFMIIAALGVGGYGVREIGKVQDDYEKRNIKFWNIFLFKFILSALMLISYILYVFLFANNKCIAYAQSFYLIHVMFDISWFFQGIEDFKKVTIRNFLIKILNIIFIFCFVKSESDLFLYVIGLSLFTTIGTMSMWVNINKYIDKPDLTKIKLFDDYKIILQMFFPTIAVQIFSIIDKTMIGLLSYSAVENGYYEQSLKIIDMSLTVITSLIAVMIPSIAKDFKE